MSYRIKSGVRIQGIIGKGLQRLSEGGQRGEGGKKMKG